MQNIKFVQLRHRGLVYVTGADARDFLQSLISNDMGGVDHDTGLYATLLTPQGKYLHDLFICEGGPDVPFFDHGEGAGAETDSGDGAEQQFAGRHYLIEADRPEDLAKRLTMYKLRADVQIKVLDDWCVVGLYGADLYAALGVRQVAGDCREFGSPGKGGRRLTDPRGPKAGVRCYIHVNDVPGEFEKLGAEPGALVDFDQSRICQGFPDGCRDIEVEKGTLLENRIDNVGGISWTKGCYVGQEVTARMKYRNLGKKQLFIVDLEGPAPSKDTPVTLAGKEVGTMKTSVPGIGLAMLRLDAIQAFQLKGGDFNAGGTQVMPRIEADVAEQLTA